MANVETSRAYALERGGPERLELRWGASFRHVRVLFDGREVASLDRKKIPRDGTEVKLPDGSVLLVRLRGVLGIELRRGESHVPGSDLEPRRVLKNAALLMGLAALADGGMDGVVASRLHEASVTGGLNSIPRSLQYALGLDAALLLLTLPTVLGSRIGLALGVAAFASRFGVLAQRSTWTLIYGVCTTWLLATHFFATFRRR